MDTSKAKEYQFKKQKKYTQEEIKAISKNAQYSYIYAVDILKGRFKLGEKAISKNAEHSYLYALDILKGRFKLGEKVISKNAYYSNLYKLDILKEKI